ncbi:MAG: hypothetical protein GX575_12095 [Candidatus Anammoximicrobium sp.]|nr:hypothetical protein [Candidatus Anammoximicrobium sp.]
MSEAAATPSPAPPSKEELQQAMKAFRKRLKLMRLDDESRLGYGPMSGGGRSGVVAIRPPDQFPQEVWDELVKQGKLKYTGRGLYELVGS